MLTRDNLILPECLTTPVPTGVLDTPEKVRRASQELYDSVRDDFEQIRISQMQSIVDSMNYVLN